MNRNNGLEIGRRLMVLRDYLFANAVKTHTIVFVRSATPFSDGASMNSLNVL